jgi:hypothetical protein
VLLHTKQLINVKNMAIIGQTFGNFQIATYICIVVSRKPNGHKKWQQI